MTVDITPCIYCRTRKCSSLCHSLQIQKYSDLVFCLGQADAFNPTQPFVDPTLSDEMALWSP